MPELSGSTYSETDASNNSAAPNGMPEGMPPSGVNDAWRAGMGAIVRFWDRIQGKFASTGSANAYVLTPTAALAAYVTGERYSFRSNFANTGAATLNISTLGAKTIKKMTSSGKADLASGDIQSAQPVTVEYDGTDLVMTTPIASSAIAIANATDYAEGSWTPVIAGSSTAGSQTYLAQIGRYIKVGNLVTIWCNVQTSAIGGTIAGNVTITGLPFSGTNVSNLFQAFSVIGGSVTLSGGGVSLAAFVSPNTTVVAIDQQGTGIALAVLPVSSLGASAQFILSGSYRTN